MQLCRLVQHFKYFRYTYLVLQTMTYGGKDIVNVTNIIFRWIQHDSYLRYTVFSLILLQPITHTAKDIVNVAKILYSGEFSVTHFQICCTFLKNDIIKLKAHVLEKGGFIMLISIYLFKLFKISLHLFYVSRTIIAAFTQNETE